MVKSPDGMYWGRCERCPPYDDLKALPEGSDICRDCRDELMKQQAQHYPVQYSQDEIRQMKNGSD